MGELSISKTMTIDASSLDNGLTIDASGKSRIFNIDDGNDETDSPVTIRGLTLTGGSAGGHGGAIHTAEDLAVASITISENGAEDDNGGAIWASGDVTVISSTISGNSAGWSDGGGISAPGDVTVTASTISRNGSDIVASGEVTVTIENSIIAGNSDSDTVADIRPGSGGLAVRYSLIGDNQGTGLCWAEISAHLVLKRKRTMTVGG
jgi:predicted outer membrane repeat protein